jgi:2-polyprenyl-3-methyl-5-hydroxy-6-metoxy-1,4-benzoquinol methylase
MNELIELSQTLYTSKNPTRRWLHCSRRDWIVSAIAELASKDSTRALEIGPGAGMYLPALCHAANSVVAADTEQAYLSHIQSAYKQDNLTTVQDNITDTHLTPHSFDLILCTEVLEHTEDPAAALKGMSQLLTSDGTLILTTPQKYSSMEMCAKIAWLPGIINLVRLIYGESIIDAGHISLLTERQLTRHIAHAGLNVEKLHKMGCYLPLVAELGGQLGKNLEQRIESLIQDTFMDWSLWTQLYILKKQQ